MMHRKKSTPTPALARYFHMSMRNSPKLNYPRKGTRHIVYRGGGNLGGFEWAAVGAGELVGLRIVAFAVYDINLEFELHWGS